MIRPLAVAVVAVVVTLVGACGSSTPSSTAPLFAPAVTPSAGEGANRDTTEVPQVAVPEPTTAATPTTEPTPPTPLATPTPEATPVVTREPLLTGASRLAANGFEPLQGKRVGIIVNQTSTLGDGTHLIDALDDQPDIDLALIFAPEHGVRGIADAGALIDDTQDPATGIAIRSLYGTDRSPALSDLAGLDVLVYDLQDVGTRFYTFISTLGLAMAAADAAGVEFMVLDRPNPLGGELVSGFERDDDQESFISQYPIPAMYGMTAGELARMIAAEGWVATRKLAEPTVVTLAGWDRTPWEQTTDWTAPSPGLPTIGAARSYPGTVFLEATTLSYGKGTAFPFMIAGSAELDATLLADELRSRALPGLEITIVTVTPDAGIAPNPRLEGIEFSAVQFSVSDPLRYQPVATGVHLLAAVRDQLGSTSFIDRAPTFDLLAGTTELRTMLENGAAANEIISAWQEDSAAFTLRRQPYLLYPAVSSD